jgi:hypothetical protein
VGLLVLQSMSSFILARNEKLLQEHVIIVRFLTMLVGAGGNAGNQASVRGTLRRARPSWNESIMPIQYMFKVFVCAYVLVQNEPFWLFGGVFLSCTVIRGLAIGTVNNRNLKEFLTVELKTALTLSIILGISGCIRAAVFLTPLKETIAITTSLFFIVLISIVLGAVLPLGFKYVRIDPAHSSTTIQVIMDILGVTITVCKCAVFHIVSRLCVLVGWLPLVESVGRLTLFLPFWLPLV